VSSLLLYSTNPWITLEIGRKYRNNKYYVWCSETYNPRRAQPGSSAAMIAPSSSPKGIFDNLACDCENEDVHSSLIKGYRRTYKRLANSWLSDGSIDSNQRNEIIATIQSQSWNIWKPVLFLIPRTSIIDPSRIHAVAAGKRAAYGPEFQVHDLDISEFEIIER